MADALYTETQSNARFYLNKIEAEADYGGDESVESLQDRAESVFAITMRTEEAMEAATQECLGVSLGDETLQEGDLAHTVRNYLMDITNTLRTPPNAAEVGQWQTHLDKVLLLAGRLQNCLTMMAENYGLNTIAKDIK
jgi:hypothetical protein